MALIQKRDGAPEGELTIATAEGDITVPASGTVEVSGSLASDLAVHPYFEALPDDSEGVGSVQPFEHEDHPVAVDAVHRAPTQDPDVVAHGTVVDPEDFEDGQTVEEAVAADPTPADPAPAPAVTSTSFSSSDGGSY